MTEAPRDELFPAPNSIVAEPQRDRKTGLLPSQMLCEAVPLQAEVRNYVADAPRAKRPQSAHNADFAHRKMQVAQEGCARGVCNSGMGLCVACGL